MTLHCPVPGDPFWCGTCVSFCISFHFYFRPSQESVAHLTSVIVIGRRPQRRRGTWNMSLPASPSRIFPAQDCATKDVRTSFVSTLTDSLFLCTNSGEPESNPGSVFSPAVFICEDTENQLSSAGGTDSACNCGPRPWPVLHPHC